MTLNRKNNHVVWLNRCNISCKIKFSQVIPINKRMATVNPLSLTNSLCTYKYFLKNWVNRWHFWHFYFFIGFMLYSVYRYTNADLKICQYLPLHMKIIRRRFHIDTPFTFWDIHTWDICKVRLQTSRNNRIR